MRMRWTIVILALLASVGCGGGGGGGAFVGFPGGRPIELVTVSPTAGAADGPSNAARLSADGRFVAFQSSATNLVAGDTEGRRDIFVRDRLVTATARVSQTPAGAGGNDTAQQ